MKEWEVTFVDQKGEHTALSLASEYEPTVEEAARLIRAHLFPVIDEVDLNDYQGRVRCPTAEWLKVQNGVEITSIRQKP